MEFFNADTLAALLTLTVMEIVLGIDNIIFISILTSRLPAEAQGKIRNIGISLALVLRLGLLFSIGWIMSLTEPFVTLFDKGFSGRDVILILGGLFLIFKATFEIHGKVEGAEHIPKAGKGKRNTGGAVLLQILLIDIVFSLDSVITAVGMAREVWIMVVAMVLSVAVMLLSAGSIHGFVIKHPGVKILALAFLLLIGVTLLVEGMGGHVSKGYIYFAMAFSLAIEMLNIRFRKNQAKAETRV
jgi:predicted tellurium resistance membrane protein TerC